MTADRRSASRTDLVRTALSPRMLVLLVVLLAAAAVCARLGAWQLDRASLRGEEQAREVAAAREAAPPQPLASVLVPQSALAAEAIGAKVVVTGRFEDGQVLVADRALDGRTGLVVVTPLRVEGPGEAALVPVARGWVPDAAAAAALAPLPAGDVEVMGYLQSGEAAGEPDGLAAPSPGRLPVVDTISPAELVNRWGGPIYAAYLVAAEVEPAAEPAPALLPPPRVPGAELDLQNLGYALQWWVFGIFAVGLWLRLVRDEARPDEPEDPDQPDGSEQPDAQEPARLSRAG